MSVLCLPVVGLFSQTLELVVISAAPCACGVTFVAFPGSVLQMSQGFLVTLIVTTTQTTATQPQQWYQSWAQGPWVQAVGPQGVQKMTTGIADRGFCWRHCSSCSGGNSGDPLLSSYKQMGAAGTRSSGPQQLIPESSTISFGTRWCGPPCKLQH